jgi:hypothetical protein
LVFSATDNADDRGLPDNVLALGTLPPGGLRVSKLWLRNFSDRVTTITGVSTTCDCAALEGLPREIGPRQSAPVTLNVDLAKEPSFIGELEVEIHVKAIRLVPIVLRARVTVVRSLGDASDIP